MSTNKEHYIEEAREFGASKQATMKDINIRNKEIEMIIRYINVLRTHFKSPKILEIGCGNGYAAEQITKQLDIKSLVCIDSCEDFIEIAKNRESKNATFMIGDALNLDFDDSSFDIIYTERCLINLDSWKKQQKALEEIRRVLKDGGVFLMIEAFTDGLNNLNEAREDVGLEAIPQPYYDLFFDKIKFLDFINGRFVDISTINLDVNLKYSTNFLSSYYFGSRVLYPSLISGKKELVYNNKFVEYFGYSSAYGNYSPVQMFILRKV